MINRASLLVTFLVLALLQVSCNSSKELSTEVRNHQVRPENMFQRLEKNSFKFTELSAKLSVKYDVNGNSKAFKAILRAKEDSIIWISVRFGMMELARIVILKDTIKMLMRTEQKYFVGSYDFIKKNYGIDLTFDFVQSLVSGNPYYLDAKNKYKSAVDKESYYLGNVNKKKFAKLQDKEQITNMLVQAFWINANYKVVEQGLKIVGNDAFSHVTYSEFEDVQGQQFAKDGQLQVGLEKPIDVKWHYTRIEIDKPLTFSFTIPTKYEQLN